MLLQALITTFLLMIPAFSQAASVTQVKGSKILLELEDEQELTPNQEVFIIDENGKRIGLVKIRQVRGSKAIGEVTKGRAVVGGVTQPRSAASSTPKAASSRARTERASSEDSEDSSLSAKKKLSGGLLLSYGSNSMSFTAQRTTPTASANVNFKGTTIGLKGFADYHWSNSISFRAAASYEPFEVKGTAESGGTPICSTDTPNCRVSFTYLGLEGAVQYNYTNSSSFRGWVGLGYAFLLTLSKSVNVPNLQSTSSTNQMYLFSTGANISMGRKNFIPIALEYGYIPGTNVKANAIFLRGGYGWEF
ncbi:MAG: hypothetical protein LW875_10340 [Proteobacteria bacterium]|jgi:hypothetical protein|nr:hypothetical protein [Pseudomonadota bacterium]